MNRKTAEFARGEHLFDGADRVVCALSGGGDSVCLLYVLRDLQAEFGYALSAAHFNHGLRGAEADADEEFVKGLCESLAIPLVVGRGDVRAHAESNGLSIEEAARELRYDFLLSQKGLIACAHHADDQAETVLINLLRGTGLRGLCAMAPKQGRIVRPLLTVTKEGISSYLEENGIRFCTDSTNLQDDALRNRLRHHVLPRLYDENPAFAAAVTRMTGLLRQENEYLDRAARELLEQAARNGGWQCGVLRDADPVLRRRALRQIMDEISDPSHVHVEAAEQLIAQENGSAFVTLPGGCILRREYGLLKPVAPQTHLPKAVNMTVREVSRLTEPADGRTVFALKPGYELGLRARQTGDELKLSGGTKTVKKLMIDRKIPAHLREDIPVITADGRCAAVYGIGTHLDFAANPGEPAVIVTLEITP